jgi:uncharacterized protein
LPSFASIAFSVFILILFAGIYLALFDLLGTLIIFLDVLFYALFTGFNQISGQFLLFLFLIALIVESIDFFMIMKGVYRPVITKKLLWMSALGAIAGASLLTPFFWGPGTWAGFFLGGITIILTLEFARQSKLRAPYRVSNRTIFFMFGRKIFKGLVALFMIALSLSNIYS